MWFLYVLWTLGSVAALLSSFLIFFLASFVVRMRARQEEFNSDLVMMISGIEPVEPMIVQQNTRAKTWDEKYEEELEVLERRMKGDSGLQDLPEPKATFGEPPTVNIQAQDGLTFRDTEGNMR